MMFFGFCQASFELLSYPVPLQPLQCRILNMVINTWPPSCSSLYSEKLSCKNDSETRTMDSEEECKAMMLPFHKAFGQTTKSSRKKHFLLESLPSCMFTLKPLSGSSRHCKDISQHILSNECWHSTASKEEPALGMME